MRRLVKMSQPNRRMTRKYRNLIGLIVMST